MTARLAGFLYLFTNATAIFAFYVRTHAIVRGDAVQTAKNIAATEQLFRLGIVSELIAVAGVVLLVIALYVVLKPINANLALLAAFWRLVENAVLAYAATNEFAALRLVHDPNLAYKFLGIYGDAFRIGFFFLGIGSAIFSYLWLRSRYIPRVIAWWGILASSLMALAELSIIAFPSLASKIGMAYMMPMGVYEFGLGFWLLIKGARTHATNE
jgi:hypothetical protein